MAEPTAARLVFETGEATSDNAGRYTAALPSDPLGNLIHVTVCTDGRMLTYIPSAKIKETRRTTSRSAHFRWP